MIVLSRKMRRTVLALGVSLSVLTLSSWAAAQDQSFPQSMFEKLDFDFGVVARGAEAKYRIKFVNTTADVVHISNVATRCTCASAKAAQDAVGPGETGYIDVSFDTKKYMRLRETAVIVHFDRPFFSEMHIPVKVYIRTDVVLTPGSISFGSVAKGTPAERKLSIAYAGRSDWAIRDVINKNKDLDVQVKELSRNGGTINYELIAVLKSTAGRGDVREPITLVTNDAGDPNIPILVEGRVETEYTVSPELVDFGVLSPGTRKTVNLIVRGRQPFTIETIESEKTAGTFEVQLPNSPRNLHVLPLTVIAPNEAGALKEEFTITIKGSEEPLTFKAHCKVVAPTAGRIP